MVQQQKPIDFDSVISCVSLDKLLNVSVLLAAYFSHLKEPCKQQSPYMQSVSRAAGAQSKVSSVLCFGVQRSCFPLARSSSSSFRNIPSHSFTCRCPCMSHSWSSKLSCAWRSQLGIAMTQLFVCHVSVSVVTTLSNSCPRYPDRPLWPRLCSREWLGDGQESHCTVCCSHWSSRVALRGRLFRPRRSSAPHAEFEVLSLGLQGSCSSVPLCLRVTVAPQTKPSSDALGGQKVLCQGDNKFMSGDTPCCYIPQREGRLCPCK